MLIPSFLRARLLNGALFGLCLLAGATASEAQVLVDFNFSTTTPAQFSNNFRRLNFTGSSRSTATQTGGLVRHDNQDGSSTTAGAVYIYDTTPANAADAENSFSLTNMLSLDLDFRATAAGSSIGIYFGDTSNINNNLLVLFNVDTAGNDTFRAFRDGTVASVGAGTQVGATQTFSPSVASAGGAFVPINFTLSVSGTTPTVSMTIAGQTFSQTFAAGDFNFAGGNASVTLRMSDASVATTPASPLEIDNLQIASVPEPSAAVFVFAGAMLLIGSRRQVWRD